MRVPPQVSDRIKEAPAQALRGVFAGIGQVLLIADRLRNKTPASQHVPPVRAPEPPETRADPAMRAAPAPQAAPTPAAPAAPVAPVAPVGPVGPAAERVAEVRDLDKTGNVRLLTSKEAGAGGTAPAAGAPLPNYDELSIASLRARLRNLDVAQVRELAEYEKAHAARADVLAMYERRIAKLQAQRSDDAQGEAAAEAGIEARAAVEAEVRAELEAEAEDET